jgi:hypothetical protein
MRTARQGRGESKKEKGQRIDFPDPLPFCRCGSPLLPAVREKGPGDEGLRYSSRRLESASAMVTPSAYSRSPPTGRPRAMRVTRTPSGPSRRPR